MTILLAMRPVLRPARAGFRIPQPTTPTRFASSTPRQTPPRVQISKTSDPSPTPTQRQSFREVLGTWRFIPFVLMGATTLYVSFYCSSVYMNYRRISSTGYKPVPVDVTDRWDKEASTFDRDMDSMERYMGMNWLRKSMTRQAYGHVLEASVGTGRNIKYYKPEECDSITMVDQSRKMVDIAYEKWRKTFDFQQHLAKVTFRHQSVIDHVKLPNPEGFDFVMQTMGLCSTPEPEALLRSLARMTKKDGRILLLEHGRSKYDWLNRVLDNTAAPHADKHGCWWNKDILKIVEDSGLEVVEVSRYHLGTTYWIELKPGKFGKTPSPEGKRVVEALREPPPSQPTEVKPNSKPWWII